MINEEFIDAIANLQKNFTEDEPITDTMQMIEEINPQLSKESKSYREGNRYLFKQDISYENAGKIVDTITDIHKYGVHEINLYKEVVTNTCRTIWIQGESPIEMMVYATKGIASQDVSYLNAILDVFKRLSERDVKLIEIYKDILSNWTWNECLMTVLKSIQDLKLNELAEMVYKIFETNEALRKEAAITLISLEEERYYPSLLNMLVSCKNDLRAQLNELREIAVAMATHSDSGSACVYRVYRRSDISDEVAGQLIPGIRKNLSYEILKDMEKQLDKVNEEKRHYNRILFLLKASNLNENVKEILHKCRQKSYLDQTLVARALGEITFENIIEELKSNKHDEKAEAHAIIQLGKSQDKRAQSILENLYNQTHDTTKKIIAGSALVERGDYEKLGNLYFYLVAPNVEEKTSREALRQLRRLRALRDDVMAEELLSAAQTLIGRSKEAGKLGYIQKILELYEGSYPTTQIGNLFLQQLKEVNHPLVRRQCIAFLGKNLSSFKEELQEAIRKQFILESQKNTDEGKETMKILIKMGRNNDAVPTVVA